MPRDAPKRLCVCTHAGYLHQMTTAGRLSWCTVWDSGGKCPCTQYQMANPPAGRPGGREPDQQHPGAY